MIFIDQNPNNTTFWNRILVIGSTAMPLTFFGFVQYFLKRENHYWLSFGWFVYVIIQIANVMGFVVESASVSGGQLHNEYGSAINLTSVSWVFFIGLSTLLLLQEYRKAKDQLFRSRIFYLLIVVLVIFAGSLTNATELQVYPVDILFNIVAALLITNSILRHKFLDITLVVRKGLLYTIPTIIIGAGYFLIISLALNIFHTSTGLEIFLLSLVVAIITAVIAQPMRDRAQSWIDRIFFREKYNSTLMLQRLSETAASVLDITRLTKMIIEEVTSTMQIENAAFLLRDEESGDYTLMAQRGLEELGNLKLNKYHPIVLRLSSNNRAVTKQDLDVKPQFRALWGEERETLDQIKAEIFIPLIAKTGMVGIFAVGPKLSEEAYTQDDQITLMTLSNQTAVAIENALLFTAEARRRNEAETLRDATSALTSSLDPQFVLNSILINLEEVVPYDTARILLLEKENLSVVAGRGFDNVGSIIGTEFPALEDSHFQEIQGKSRPVISTYNDGVESDDLYNRSNGVRSLMGVPLIARAEVIGYLSIASQADDLYKASDATIAQAFANQAAVAIENARLFTDGSRRIRNLQALRTIGHAITSSMDLRLTLDVLLEQVTSQLDVDTATVLLLNPSLQMLEVTARRGFKTGPLQRSQLRLGEGYAGRAALERTIIHVRDLRKVEDEYHRAKALAAEGYVAYYVIPLIAKEQVKGVLEILHRVPIESDVDWMEFLEALATEAAIAIDNANLFENLQRSNMELALSYDATLQGLVRALDLRDKETEGHTQRVTDMTLKLAILMGFPENELVHVRRGALLHDIGKIAISDKILHKPGLLSEEEWEEMRLHPTLAYEFLSTIPFLRPAVDIPYAHHEKWDGTGYPRGLFGEQIPLIARIFAVVDVFDALCHDRPYRSAWSREKALRYIQDQSGLHFDPQVVSVFLQMLNQ